MIYFYIFYFVIYSIFPVFNTHFFSAQKETYEMGKFEKLYDMLSLQHIIDQLT